MQVNKHCLFNALCENGNVTQRPTCDIHVHSVRVVTYDTLLTLPSKHGLCARPVYITADTCIRVTHVVCCNTGQGPVPTANIKRQTFSISSGENTFPAGFFTIRTSAPV